MTGSLHIVDRINAAEPVRSSKAVSISATPYHWRAPEAIPQRPWVYGRWFLRGTVTACVAPGGVGKSTFLAGTALAIATARGFMGKTTWEGPQRVWLWNLEDDLDELTRSIQAAAKHFVLDEVDLAGHLFVDSAMEGSELCTAVETDGQFSLLEPIYEAITAELIARKIDVLVIDPFVSSHEVEENANSKIDKIVKKWARVAKVANCSIVLVHHTSKAGAADVTALSARGAVSLVNACRAALVFNRMDADTAIKFGIEGDEERRRYFSVLDDKHNRAPAGKADWHRLVSVYLGNGENGKGDSVGVAEPWSPPNTFDGVTTSHLLAVQEAVTAGQWRKSSQSPDWVGNAVAEVLELDASRKTDRARINQLLKTWTENGALIEVRRKDSHGSMRPFVEAGHLATNDGSAPRKGVVRKGAEVGNSHSRTTTPLRGGGSGVVRGEEPSAPAISINENERLDNSDFDDGEWHGFEPCDPFNEGSDHG